MAWIWPDENGDITMQGQRGGEMHGLRGDLMQGRVGAAVGRGLGFLTGTGHLVPGGNVGEAAALGWAASGGASFGNPGSSLYGDDHGILPDLATYPNAKLTKTWAAPPWLPTVSGFSMAWAYSAKAAASGWSNTVRLTITDLDAAAWTEDLPNVGSFLWSTSEYAPAISGLDNARLASYEFQIVAQTGGGGTAPEIYVDGIITLASPAYSWVETQVDGRRGP